MAYNKKKQMDKACDHLTELIALEYPKKGIRVRYEKVGTEVYAEFSEFEKQYHKIRLGDEYILIYDPEGILLYAINVTYDSMLTAVDEAMRLIAAKF